LSPGEAKEYRSSHSVVESEVYENDSYNVLTSEFIRSLTTSRIASHKIKLKIGAPIMLLRKINQTKGLCNESRLIVTKLAKHVIGEKVISSNKDGNKIYIPKMFMSPSQSP